MEAFKRIVRLGVVPFCGGGWMNVYAKVEFDGSRLSISGVEGPKSNGDCHGSCGQIDMSYRTPEERAAITPAPGWTVEMIGRFFDIWHRWHLNDMRAYDAEMAAAGWPERAQVPMLGYSFSLTSAAWEARREAEAAALRALRAEETFTPTPEQARIAALPLSFVEWQHEATPPPDSLSPDYERSRDITGHNKGGLKPPERKTLGWLKPSEHPDGLLGRKLRPEGPGYGSAWFREEVPETVLEFLKGLPAADREPAWV